MNHRPVFLSPNQPRHVSFASPLSAEMVKPWYRSKSKLKLAMSTENLLKQLDLQCALGQGNIDNAIASARSLAYEFGHIPVMTSFILDTGAGVHLKCYAKDLPTREVQYIYIHISIYISMHSANGPITSNRITNVKFRENRQSGLCRS